MKKHIVEILYSLGVLFFSISIGLKSGLADALTALGIFTIAVSVAIAIDHRMNK